MKIKSISVSGKSTLDIVNNALDISKVENSELEIMTVNYWKAEHREKEKKHKQEGGTQKNPPVYYITNWILSVNGEV